MTAPLPASTLMSSLGPTTRPGRILVAEDDADVGRFIELTLVAEGFEIQRAVDGPSAVSSAVANPPDLVVLDVGMPGLDGMSVCRELRRDPRTAAVPVIMLTARVQQSDKVMGLDCGADDYVTKPFDPAELVARIHAALRRTRQLRDVSPLTGLPGNAAIFRHLEVLLEAGTPFGLVHADLDNFKAFNDRYGFAAGDEVIKATAAVVTTALDAVASGASPSFAGHVGGDDFVLVCAADAAEALADAAVCRFDALIPSYYDDLDRARGGIEVVSRTGELRQYPIMTISMGIVLSTSRVFASPAEMASVASEMKSVAKGAATSSYCVDRRSS